MSNPASAPTPSAPGSGRAGRCAGALACLAVLLAAFAWALASPVGSSPDEQAHIIYAWGTATGQTTPWTVQEVEGSNAARYAKVSVPTALLETPAVCNRFDPSTPACSTIKPVEDADGDGRTTVLTYMDRYPPTYYLPIGLVLRAAIGAGATGIVATTIARVVSGVLSLGVLVLVWTTMAPVFHRAAVVGAVAALVTPMALFLSSSVNPNGLEVSLTALVAASVITARAHLVAGRRPPRWLRAQLVLAALALGLTRPASPLWAGLLLLILVVPTRAHGRRRLAPWLRLGLRAIIGLVLAVVVMLAAFAYDNASRGGGAAGKDLTDWFALPTAARWTTVLFQLGNLPENGYRYLGWGDTPLPALFFLLWIAGTAAVLAAGARTRSARSIRTGTWPAVLFLLLACAAVALQSERSGFAWQGRYFLPVVAGFIVLLAGRVTADDGDTAPSTRPAAVFAVSQAVIAVAALAITCWRYRYGFIDTATHFDAVALPSLTAAGSWAPALPIRVIVLIGIVSAALALSALHVVERRVPGPTEPVALSRAVPGDDEVGRTTASA